MTDAAYVIVCLIEQNASFQRLGYRTAHNTAAKNAALAIVKQLCG